MPELYNPLCSGDVLNGNAGARNTPLGCSSPSFPTLQIVAKIFSAVDPYLPYGKVNLNSLAKSSAISQKRHHTDSGVDSKCCTHYDYDVGTPTPHWGVGDIVIYAKQLKCFPWSATDLKTTAEKFLSLDLTLRAVGIVAVAHCERKERKNTMNLIENLKCIIKRWWTCDVRYRSEFQRKGK